MAQITLRNLAAATGPTGGSTGIFFTSQGSPLSVDTVDYNFLNLNYQKLDKNLNLSDVQSAQTSRTNLGLGTLAVYNAGGATGLGNIGASGITQLLSGSTGALVVTGGVGVGGNLTVSGTITGNLTGNVTGSASTLSTPRTLWGQSFNGSADVTGNISSAGNIGATGTLTVDDSVMFNKTTDSTAYNNGAVVVAGGVGITKSVNVNTNLTVGNVLKCTGATGLYVTQDAIIGNNLNVGTNIYANAMYASEIGNPSSGALLVNVLLDTNVALGITGYNGTNKYLINSSAIAANRTITLPLLTNNDTFVFENHIQSLTNKTLSTGTTIVNAGNVGATGVIQFSSGATGAVIVTGGVGVGGNLTVSGTARAGNITSTGTAIFSGSLTGSNANLTNGSLTSFGNIGASGITQLLSGSTGALVVTGGAGVGGNLTVSGNTTLGAGTTSLAPLTFRSGTNLSAATAGTVEYDGTIFYATPTTNLGRVVVSTPTFHASEITNSGVGSSNQNIFSTAEKKISLPIGVYRYDLGFSLSVTGSTVSSSIRLNLLGGLGNAVGTSTWYGMSTIGNSNTATFFKQGATGLGALVDITTASASNPRIYNTSGSGIIRITTAGTLVPCYNPSATMTSGTANISDTYLIITPLSSDGAAGFTGNWVA